MQFQGDIEVMVETIIREAAKSAHRNRRGSGTCSQSFLSENHCLTCFFEDIPFAWSPDSTIRSDSKGYAMTLTSRQSILILLLAVVYYIGFSILGLGHAIFLATMIAALSLIPYVGEAFGVLLALAVGLLKGMGGGGLASIIIIFVIAQVLENYVLTPYIVGSQINLTAIVSPGACWDYAARGGLNLLCAHPCWGSTDQRFSTCSEGVE